jgi:hypothetical protein
VLRSEHDGASSWRSSSGVYTGLSAQPPLWPVIRGEEPTGAHDLLARHLGVPVVSASPRYRTVDREVRDPNPQTNFRSLRTREGVMTWLLTLGLAALVIVIVLAVASLFV